MSKGNAGYLVFDLGAESGRAMLGNFDGERLLLQEVHRFPNGGVHLGNHLHWDVPRLWSEIKLGCHLAFTQTGVELKSIGLDTWGVDFGLLDAKDNLIVNPFHYRDPRTSGIMKAVFDIVPRTEIYAQTGIQFMEFNTLFQLFSMVLVGDPALLIAKTFLNMPDLFNFFLTGVKVSEFTIATTTQFYNPLKQVWASDMLETLGIPTHIMGKIVHPGTALGKLRHSLTNELGLPAITVVTSAGHDTASAIAAVPAEDPDFIYLSSGTWSLMGVELERPLINSDSLEADLTNEGGMERKICFLKNIVGLWLVQECRRQWRNEGDDLGYAELIQFAGSSPAFLSMIDPNDPQFLAPENMVRSIRSYCRATKQIVPVDRGTILRCVLESLALEYRRVAEQIDRLTGKYHSTIHIIGGGSQNSLLNQFTANATGRTVIAGPVEATAIGNILVQAIAMGEIASVAEGRQIVRRSFATEIYRAVDGSAWDEAYENYTRLQEASSL